MRTLTILITTLLLTACSQNVSNTDVYGNFEAVETIVSAEMAGKIIELNITEGDVLKADNYVGMIDTILYPLQKNEIAANKTKLKANLANIDAQTKVLEQQKANMLNDLERISKMKESGAATQKQFDDITGAINVIDAQILASRSQKAALASEINVIESKEAIVNEQLKKCKIINPKAGTVIEKYSEQGEVTAPGKPIYKIADLDNIILRAYVSGAQLHEIKIGSVCKVLIDSGKKEYQEFAGRIIWIADKAEFTPKIIQTKEERVSMVYAIKIEVKNNGSLKIGMPGEALFLK